MDLSIQLLDPIKLKLVNKFYKQSRNSGKASRSDQVWVIRNPQEIVAALRLIDVKCDLLLRSMCVKPELRKQGLGTFLLEGIVDALAIKDCYCYPFTHLVTFYRVAGFEEVAVDVVPEWISTPYHRYKGQGRDIVIMKRSQTT